MRKIRGYAFSIIIMLITAMLSLVIVSILTYLFKWYADKAMVGIIVAYVLAGFVGGFCFKRLEKKQYGDERKNRIGRKVTDALILSCIFMVLLFALSIFAFQNPFEISGRLFMIWLLLTSSTFLGRIL